MRDLAAGIGSPYLALLIGLGVGIGLSLLSAGAYWLVTHRRIAALRHEAETLISSAEHEAKQIVKAGVLELQETRLEMKAVSDQEAFERRQALESLERQLARREDALREHTAEFDRRTQGLTRRESKLAERETAARASEEEAERYVAQQRARLEEISGLTAAEAKTGLSEQLLAEAKSEAALRLRQIEEDLHERANVRAQHIITTAIERCAVDTVFESTVAVVALPSDEMKGRIIGRDGRNIQALQQVTGVDFVVDDTPGAVILSAFDPIRRITARMTLERLLADGRIHPARIEEVYAKAQTDMQATIQQAGDEAVLDLGLHGVHPEIVRLLGHLRFRTSYGQNVLNHSIEVAHICGMMAAEYGLDERIARRAGLLHDIGKAVSHEAGGAHALIGGETARRFGETDIVVNAIEGHHRDVPSTSVYTLLTEAADAVSAARPGARREQLETYLRRVDSLEKIALSMVGVERAFAVQAGRELRVIADAAQLSDAEMLQLSRDIARAIEAQLEYPGRIRVTCIRETRAVEYAM